MKECEFIDMIERIDTKPSTDQKITEHLLNYDASMEQPRQGSNVKMRLRNLRSFPKFAAACIIITLLGTTTAIASSFFVTTHPIKYTFEKSHKTNTKSNTLKSLKFGNHLLCYNFEGSLTTSNTKIINKDTGKVLAHKDRTLGKDFLYTPKKSGDEAFNLLKTPNLTPTYLYDHFILGQEGYNYSERKGHRKDSIIKNITAEYITYPDKKWLYLDYTPNEKDDPLPNTMKLDGSDLLTYNTSTYTTKGGLICNIQEEKAGVDIYDAIYVFIYLDSSTFGKGTYILSFNHVDMDEVKLILESIPITTKGIKK